MFSLIRVSPVYGDSTAKYDVVLDREYTVYNFITTVITRNTEWGNIKLKHNDEIINNSTLEYKLGEIQSSNISSELLNLSIISAICYGGYSRMDYILEIHNT